MKLQWAAARAAELIGLGILPKPRIRYTRISGSIHGWCCSSPDCTGVICVDLDAAFLNWAILSFLDAKELEVTT